MENESRMIQVNIQMTPEMQTALKIQAALLGGNVSALVRKAIDEYLAKYTVSVLPHPEDAEAIPLVEVAK